MAKSTPAGAVRAGTKTSSRSAPIKSASKPAAKPVAKQVAKPVARPAVKVQAKVPAVVAPKGAGKAANKATLVEPKPAVTAAATECPKSSEITTLNAAVRFLLARPDFERQRSISYGEQTFKLDRMQRILDRLGNPHQKIKTVHVAGTNGKGSTVAMIASMLRTAGYAVGVYTSPHLVDIRERVQTDGQMIGKTDFV